MAEEDKNKDKLQGYAVKISNTAGQDLDRLTMLQDVPESNLSAKQYAADEASPIDGNLASVAGAKQAVSGVKDAAGGIFSAGVSLLSSLQNTGITKVVASPRPTP